MYLNFNLHLPKGQTHREMRAQSHGSVFQYIDCQTAEVIFTLAVFGLLGKEERFEKTFVLLLQF